MKGAVCLQTVEKKKILQILLKVHRFFYLNVLVYLNDFDYSCSKNEKQLQDSMHVVWDADGW